VVGSSLQQRLQSVWRAKPAKWLRLTFYLLGIVAD
jgi:hypothetical protein